MFVDKDASNYASSLEVLKKVAAPFKGKALFVTVPPAESRVYEFFEVTNDQLPTLIIADMKADNGKYLVFWFYVYVYAYVFIYPLKGLC